MFAVHVGSQGFDSHRWNMSEQIFRSNRPGYPHAVCSELENSGIRVAVGDCSITECWRWRLPYQTTKLYMCRQTHYKHDEDGPTLLGVPSHGYMPLSHSGTVVTRIGLHTHKGSHCLLIYIILLLGTLYKILKLLNCRICSISFLSHLQLLEMEMTGIAFLMMEVA